MEVWQCTSPLMRGEGPLFHQDLAALNALASMLRRCGALDSACATDAVFRNIE